MHTPRRRLMAIGAVLVLLAAIAAAGCIGNILPAPPAAVAPVIDPVPGGEEIPDRVYRFSFEGKERTVTIPVNESVYYGAKQADKAMYLNENLTKEEWVPIYYRAFSDDPSQQQMYRAILDQFGEIRDEEGLDDDRYLELIAVFVQSLPYESDATLVEPKFPVELSVEGMGDCDDKSLLLAALLSQEGYGVSLLFFEEETHMSVGVLSDAYLFRNTTYTYLETTNVTYVGVVPSKLGSGAEIRSDPLVIQIGDGDRFYGSGDQTLFIRSCDEKSRESAEVLSPELKSLYDELERLGDLIEAQKQEMNLLNSENRIAEYNRRVAGYNREISEYNTKLEEYRALLEEYEGYVEIHNYLVSHTDDRTGSYEWLTARV